MALEKLITASLLAIFAITIAMQAPPETLIDCSGKGSCDKVPVASIESCGTKLMGFEYRKNAENPPYCISHLNNISDVNLRVNNQVMVPLDLDNGYKVKKYSPGLEDAWDLEFTGEDTAIVTEQKGRIKSFEIARNGSKLTSQDKLNVTVDRNSGLMGLAVDPNYSQNKRIYLQYSYSNQTAEPDMRLRNRISSFKFDKNGLSDEEILVEGIEVNRHHTGGRLDIGPEGDLFATVGESNAPDKVARILRINLETGNSTVYSRGHRNPQGLAWHPETGKMYATEHGTVHMDEINIIKKGNNYGWSAKICDRYRAENPADIQKSKEPLICFKNWTLAPSGATFVDSKRSPWHGDMFIGGLSGNYIHRVDFDGSEVVDQSVFYINRENVQKSRLSRRIRDVEYFNGSLWALGDKKGLAKLTPN